MPTLYTAQPSVTKTPSPAPGPGVLPAINLPADITDDVNAASVTQAMEVPTDFVGHIQSSVRLDVPVLNAAGSGFTAPSYVAFGGTVTPSGSVKIAAGLRFVVQIQTGGAVGVATFKTSIDGGNTYGGLQTTAASMTDATTGITVAFAGTLTANGTAMFRGAFTPVAAWTDQAGNLRSLNDHNGYPMGRIYAWEEKWDWTTNSGVGAQTLSLPSASYQRWALAQTANFTSALGGPNGGSFPTDPQLSITSSSPVNGNNSRWTAPGGSGGLMFPATFMSLACEFEGLGSVVGTAASALQKVGFSTVGTGVIGGAENAVGFVKRTGDSTWFGYTANAGAVTAVNTGISCLDGAVHNFKFELHGSGSPYGALARFFVDGAVFEITTNLPPVGGALHHFTIATDIIGAGVTSTGLSIGPTRAIWNRNALSIAPGI